MRPRIFLLHAYRFSIEPIGQAFAELWPAAEALPVLDQSLYADAGADGTLPSDIVPRLERLFRHCELSGGRAIVFTGSTFGPAVEQARRAVSIPVLKSDEAMAEAAVRQGRRILLVATAKRAIPVLRANLEAAAVAAGKQVEIGELWVAAAKAANDAGRHDEHDRQVADAVAAAKDWDVAVLGQISMTPALRHMPAETLPEPSRAPRPRWPDCSSLSPWDEAVVVIGRHCRDAVSGVDCVRVVGAVARGDQ